MSGLGISYPPPTENLAIFDSSVFTTNNIPLTIAEGYKYFLAFPSAQGTENLQTTNVAGILTANANVVLNSGSATTTTTLSPSGVSYGSPAITQTWSNIINGTGGNTSFTITSNAVGTNSWSFTIPNSYGRAFTYSLYSNTTPTTYSKNIASNPPFAYGNITLNGSFIFATGNGVYQPYSGTSQTFVDYCSGAQNTHNISAGGGGYVMSVINTMGQTITWTIASNSVNSTSTQSGATPCPAVANPSSFTTNYTITIPTAIASCSLTLVGVVIAS